MPRPKKWPQVLKRDSVEVKIYLSVNKGYESFTVLHGVGKDRKRLTRSTYQKAKDLADQKLVELASGLTPEKQLTSGGFGRKTGATLARSDRSLVLFSTILFFLVAGSVKKHHLLV